MSQTCQYCGEEITDLSLHPAASLCQKCRKLRLNSCMTGYQRYGHLLEGYLARQNYPEYVRPKKILSIEPDLFLGYDLSLKGQIRILGGCIGEWRGSRGERYVKYTKRFWKLTQAEEPLSQKVTA